MFLLAGSVIYFEEDSAYFLPAQKENNNDPPLHVCNCHTYH